MKYPSAEVQHIHPQAMRALARAKIFKNTRGIRMHLRVIYASLSACWNIRIVSFRFPRTASFLPAEFLFLRSAIRSAPFPRSSYSAHHIIAIVSWSIAASCSHTSVLDPKQELEAGIGLQVLRQSALTEIQERRSLGTMVAVTKAMRISMFSS